MSRSSGGVPAADAAIPQLSRLTRASEVARLLETALLTGSRPWMARGEGMLDVRAVTVLRAHPGSRWTLRYAVRRGGAESTFIAKVFARDRGDVATVLSTLRARGLGCGQTMQANAPIAYLPTLRVFLLEEVPGETARAALRCGQGGVGERTARWLAAFHAAAMPLPAAYRLRDPLVKARRWARALDGDAPALGREARRLLAALAETRPPWPPAAPRVVHGDFGASHVYLAAETTTVIDWDAWKVGDCAEDAGRFLASLHRIAACDPARREAVAHEAQAFAQTYRTAVPAARRGLAFYEALACLRKASRAAKGGVPSGVWRAEALIAAGERALAGDHRAPWGRPCRGGGSIGAAHRVGSTAAVIAER